MLVITLCALGMALALVFWRLGIIREEIQTLYYKGTIMEDTINELEIWEASKIKKAKKQ